jgi:uncharacterized protein (TIGR02246 family)
MAQEKMLWAAWAKRDGEPFKKVLAQDAMEVIAGTRPAVGRDAIVKDITSHTCETKSFALQDPRLRMLSADVALLTYTATQDTICGKDKLPPKVLATSIRVKQQGKWMQVHYQETPIE